MGDGIGADIVRRIGRDAAGRHQAVGGYVAGGGLQGEVPSLAENDIAGCRLAGRGKIDAGDNDIATDARSGDRDVTSTQKLAVDRNRTGICGRPDRDSAVTCDVAARKCARQHIEVAGHDQSAGSGASCIDVEIATRSESDGAV